MTEILETGLHFSAYLCTGCLTQSALGVHNYIDPGTGSIILQIVIGSIVGALFMLKVYWRKVQRFLSGIFSKTNKEKPIS
jgi:hypothetical protein